MYHFVTIETILVLNSHLKKIPPSWSGKKGIICGFPSPEFLLCGSFAVGLLIYFTPTPLSWKWRIILNSLCQDVFSFMEVTLKCMPVKKQNKQTKTNKQTKQIKIKSKQFLLFKIIIVNSIVAKRLWIYESHGFKSRAGLNFFPGLIFTTAQVVFITVKIAFRIVALVQCTVNY